MKEEKKYKKAITKCTTYIEFNNSERWKPMPDLSDGSYFVSDLGRIMRLNANGIFNENKTHLFENEYYVRIETEGEKRKLHKRIKVGRLVLRYFVGGNRERRRYAYIDGCKSNCRLDNLRWKSGFVDEVDFNYLSKLNTYKMTSESIVVKDFLITKNVGSIIELIQSKEKLIRYIDYTINCKYFQHNDYMDFVLLIIDRVNNGGFKPKENKYTYPNQFKNYIVGVFKNEAYKFAKNRRQLLPLIENINYLTLTPEFSFLETNNPVF